ncbi:hypothetical protein [Streptomyces canarius]
MSDTKALFEAPQVYKVQGRTEGRARRRAR